MKWISEAVHPKYTRFIIEGDEAEGFYLYVFEGEYGPFDYLQDTFEIAVQQAFDEFGIPKDSWRKEPD